MENIYEIEHNFKQEQVDEMVASLTLTDVMEYSYQLEAIPHKSMTHFGVQVMGIDFNENLLYVAICTILAKTMKAIPVQYGEFKTYNWIDR